MKLKTVNKSEETSLRDYPDEKVRWIFIERNSYVLKCVHEYGEDYGGSQHDENTETTYHEIENEQIIVRGGHFAGACLLGEYSSFNGGSSHTFNEICLFADGSGKNTSARYGSSFSNDDHDRWDYTTWTIVERPKDME